MEERISVSKILKFFGVIIVIGGFLYGAMQYIDQRIKHSMNDERFIKKVASHVRPYVIFDVNETIHVDGGAMQYLEKIEVKIVARKEKETGLPRLDIIITPKNHLAYAPVLETMSLTTFYVAHKRGSRHQWIYELTATSRIVGPSDEVELERFRLEILR
jgi:hypothetical protein